ncbi:MAG: restriction endonuclease subunit S, partial [Chloroflexota bacterium]
SVFSTQSIDSTIQHLPASTLRLVRYPAPPIDEQKKIVDYLDTQTQKLDKLSQTIYNAIDLLQERRVSLISAAVTGQIEVMPA